MSNRSTQLKTALLVLFLLTMGVLAVGVLIQHA